MGQVLPFFPGKQMLIVPKADSLTQVYWDGVQLRELRIQKCLACDHAWHPPLYICPKCRSKNIKWIAISGRGTVYSFTIVHHAAHEAVVDSVPYLVALVSLAEGPRIVSNILNCQFNDVKIGMQVNLTFQEISKGVLLPQFEPIADLF